MQLQPFGVALDPAFPSAGVRALYLAQRVALKPNVGPQRRGQAQALPARVVAAADRVPILCFGQEPAHRVALHPHGCRVVGRFQQGAVGAVAVARALGFVVEDFSDAASGVVGVGRGAPGRPFHARDPPGGVTHVSAGQPVEADLFHHPARGVEPEPVGVVLFVAQARQVALPVVRELHLLPPLPALHHLAYRAMHEFHRLVPIVGAHHVAFRVVSKMLERAVR